MQANINYNQIDKISEYRDVNYYKGRITQNNRFKDRWIDERNEQN